MPIFAIIETGGKQHKVAVGEKVKIEKLPFEVGDTVTFDKVLLRADGSAVSIGTPYLEGAHVEGKMVSQIRDKKKLVFRYHAKTRYRKKKGHRQPISVVEIVRV